MGNLVIGDGMEVIFNNKGVYDMKKFHSLSAKEQDKIRRDYKNKYKKSYDYSIRLFILYVILGVFSVIGLYILLYIDVMLGSILLTMSFILLGIDLYFLNKSNDKFYRYLKKKGYVYK